MILGAIVGGGCDNNNGQGKSPSNSARDSETYVTRETPQQLTRDNEVRTKIGLPVIDGEWYLYRSRGNQEDWRMHNSDAVTKSVFFDSVGNTLNEDNSYFSGKKYVDVEGQGFEEIIISYDYRTNKIGLYYSGTNSSAIALVSQFATPFNISTNIVGAMGAARNATKGWAHPVE